DEEDFWYKNYDEAIAEAKEENKKLFIDIGAPFCSICKAIDNTIFKDKMVLEVLQEFIPVKINGADSSDQACNHIKQTCTVLGFPTILVIDPHTGTLIRRWGGELYERKPESFAHELKEILELD
ncbi:MAG TPA: thioredoxin family protein, partial [Candidatus Babeliales bacterium]|nr:thioredoxin family protein [Candidatus Babeliales bacterium]